MHRRRSWQFGTIFAAELARRLRSRSFILGLLFGGIGIAVVTRLPALILSVQSGAMHTIALSGPSALVAPADALLQGGGYAVHDVPPPRTRPTSVMLRSWRAGSLVVLARKRGGLAVTIYADDPDEAPVSAVRSRLLPLELALRTHRTPHEMRAELAFPVAVHSVTRRFHSAAESAAAHAVAYLLLFLLYMLIVFNNQLVITSVAEEKTSRVAEILVATVDLSSLLAAKIAASTLLAALQMASWLAIAAVLTGGGAAAGAGSAGADALAAISPETVIGFPLFFVLGFLQMSVLSAGIASLVNRTEDLGSVAGPLFLPVIVAFVLAIMTLAAPNAPFAVVASFVPVLSPFVMFARVAVSNVPPLSIGAAALVDLVSVALFAIAGGRLYRVGMLLYGRTPSWPQILRAIFSR